MKRLVCVSLIILAFFVPITTFAGSEDNQQEFNVNDISAMVSIPDGFDVFSKNNPVADDVLEHYNMKRDDYNILVSLHFSLLWMFPRSESYPPDFKIDIKVKEKDTYMQVGNLRIWPESDRNKIVTITLR